MRRRLGEPDPATFCSDPDTPSAPSEVELPNLATDTVGAERAAAKANMRVRIAYAIYWIVGFVFVVLSGHFYLGVFCQCLTALMFREIVGLKRSVEKDEQLPFYFSLRWYFYVVTLYGMNHRYQLALLSALEEHWPLLRVLRPAVEWIEIHFSMVIFSLFLLGFVTFIMSLRRFSLRYQMQQFGYLVLSLLFIICPTVTFVGLIYAGIYWFFLATGCVICNDIFAYLVGVNFGRTRLLLISPKKTVEGFLGASIITPIFALTMGSFLTMFPYFICPANEIKLVPFESEGCQPHPVFEWQLYHLGLSFFRPSWVNELPFHDVEFSFWAMPVQFHLLVISLFASLFAPFGGFFASAFKRAIHVKDFGDSIPGHGGIADRFDCQLIMTAFTYIYIKTFVFRSAIGVSSVDALLSHIQRLSASDQSLLLEELGRMASSVASATF